jgi:hypothetical protein
MKRRREKRREREKRKEGATRYVGEEEDTTAGPPFGSIVRRR